MTKLVLLAGALWMVGWAVAAVVTGDWVWALPAVAAPLRGT
jgi:hypothetical protein